MKSYTDITRVVREKQKDDAERKKVKLRAYSNLKKKAKLKALPRKAKKNFNTKAYLKAIDSPYKL